MTVMKISNPRNSINNGPCNAYNEWKAMESLENHKNKYEDFFSGTPAFAIAFKSFLAIIIIFFFLAGASSAGDVVIDNGNAYVDGSVGIGTAGPITKLDVRGIATISDSGVVSLILRGN